jgi:hypothetical protein
MKGSKKIQKKRKREYGEDGLIIQDQSDFTTISGYQVSNQNNELTLLAPSRQLSDDENFLSRTKKKPGCFNSPRGRGKTG